MAKIVTMGEIMLRLSPEGNFRFVQTDKFNIIPGGGEANVAISCANYGHDSYFVSKLPKHEIGQIDMASTPTSWQEGATESDSIMQRLAHPCVRRK